MSAGVVTNVMLPVALELLRSSWTPDPRPVLRLFRNDYEPVPQSEDTDFVECNWANYASVFLGGALAAPTKTAEGHWQIESNVFEFTAPTSGLGNPVFGWYVTLSGGILMAQRFTAALQMVPGAAPFRLRVTLSAKSESIIIST